MARKREILARRLGKTVHVSALRFKLEKFADQFPAQGAECLEDWLIELANARGARIVLRNTDAKSEFIAPDEADVTNAELIVGICQLQCLDRPQMLRLAAQLISRGAVNIEHLKRLAEQERIGPILAELSQQALKVDPKHRVWQMLHQAFQQERPLKASLLHWTRLAEPVMKNGMCNAERWELVS